MSSKYKLLFVIAVCLHLFVSLATYHPDIRAFILANKFIQKGEITTFYDHVSKLPTTDPLKKIYGDDIFIYPPLAYLIPSIIYTPFTPYINQEVETILLKDSALYNQRLFDFSLLIFKLPFLIFTLLTAIYLPKLFTHQKTARLSQLIWLLSPVTILVSAGIGQVDSILVFFLLLAMIMAKKGSYSLSAIFIALSALIKPMGLILLPLITIYVYRKEGLKKSILATLSGLVIWLIFILPFLSSPAFKMYALLASLTSKTTYAGIAISGGTTIPWVYIFYTLISIQLYRGRIGLQKSFGLTLLSTIALIHFHPQWFLWLTPWLIYYSLTYKKIYLLVIALVCWVIIWLSFDASLNLGLFLPLKNIFTATTYNFIHNSSLESMARAGLVAILFSLIFSK